MSDFAGRQWHQSSARSLLARVWPMSMPSDSEVQRRKKFAVRAGHLAEAVMVVAAVAESVVASWVDFSGRQLAALGVATLAYLVWSAYGTSSAVRWLLWEQVPPPPRSSHLPRCGVVAYFAIQVALAGLVYHLGDCGRSSSSLWLVLLPPVANGVFLLQRAGVALVVVMTAAVFVLNVVRWQGWNAVPSALLAFLFAILFTLVFTLLVVSSEKARNEGQRLAGELGEANRKLREYAAQAEELAVTRERNRLAREIHDTLGHYLTIVNVQIEAARALQDRDPARTRAALEKAQSLTHEGLQEIRRSVATLRASPLDDRPLADALRALVDECRATGLATEMEVLGEPRGLSPQGALTLYRAGQEGLTNVRKHARAQTARLVLDFQNGARIRLRVGDDGVGAVEPAATTGGFGLLGLRERVQLLGGEVQVRTAPGTGFTLEVEVPG